MAMRSTLFFQSTCSGNERLGFYGHSCCNREKKYLFCSNIFLPQKDIKNLGCHSKHQYLILFVLHKLTGPGYRRASVRTKYLFWDSHAGFLLFQGLSLTSKSYSRVYWYICYYEMLPSPKNYMTRYTGYTGKTMGELWLLLACVMCAGPPLVHLLKFIIKNK